MFAYHPTIRMSRGSREGMTALLEVLVAPTLVLQHLLGWPWTPGSSFVVHRGAARNTLEQKSLLFCQSLSEHLYLCKSASSHILGSPYI